MVMKIGFDRNELLEALQQQERNQMTVAYYLILDHKRRKMLGTSPVMHSASGAAGPAVSAQHAELNAAAAEAISAERALAARQAPPSPKLAPTMSSEAQRSLAVAGGDPTQRRWHLGVQARRDALSEIVSPRFARLNMESRAEC